MNIEKMCRCCLANDGPLMTIFNETSSNKHSLADMLKEIANVQPDPNDKLPDKACLTCIQDINQSFGFKLKCENSNRTLHQLFCSTVMVDLQNSTENPESRDFADYTQNDLQQSYSSIVKEETDIEAASINKSFQYKDDASNASAECISIASSPVSFKQSPSRQRDATNASAGSEITDNQHEFLDSESNSYDLEFISEKPDIHEPIVILQDQNPEEDESKTNMEEAGGEVEFTFENISSPQWIDEEDESYLNLVNEDLNLEDYQRLNKNMEKSNNRLNNADKGSGSGYQCAICKQEFSHHSEFDIHFDTHEKPYPCLHCNYLFDDYLSLCTHLVQHTNGSIKTKKVSKKISSSSTLKTPKTKLKRPRRKRVGEKRWTCDLCPMKFHTKCVLDNHRRIHTGEKPFKCRYCERTFIQSSTRSNHEKTHTGDRRYKCQYCDKTFIQSGTRTSHERIHTGEKRYECRFCSKRFIQQSVLQSHEITHSRVIPFNCSICEKGFMKQSALDKHYHHHGIQDKLCPYCGIKFSKTTHAKQHMKTEHPIQT